MKHSNVAIFIPHNGCPHKCSFCDQRNITGQAFQPDANFVSETIEKSLGYLKENSVNAEIAFFGGSFTAIDRQYMLSLLDATKPYISRFMGIRLSTRPDYIDDEVLSILKSYGVTSIELGAQSMDDEVLNRNNRGHNAECVVKASQLIHSYGIKLGLQMMTGLPGSTPEKDVLSAKEFIKLNPDTVRIYPTITMKNTDLEQEINDGSYIPYSREITVDLCADLLKLFSDNDINVIRLGLHYSDSLVNNSVAGFYHPAFRELCESKIYYNIIKELLINKQKGKYTFGVAKGNISKAIGQKRSNILEFTNLGYDIGFFEDKNLKKYEINITNK